VPKNLMSRPASGRLTALLKLDVEQLKEAVTAPHSRMRLRSPMGANRALVAKCAPVGFRESLARFRTDRPNNQPNVCRANPEPVFGPWRGWRGSNITSGRHFDATLFPSSKRGSPLVGHRACRSATVVLNILNGPRGARAELHPTSHTGGNGLRASPGASPVR
jgi:hypothetical protein